MGQDKVDHTFAGNMGETMKTGTGAAGAASRELLAWADRHRRDLPWRGAPGAARDPYRVWLSEIMLQQTTVATVAPRFERFLRRWPSVVELAAAPLDAVLQEWQGLGYYARARNLHRAAQAVAAAGGRFPDTQASLRALPGVGAYTAAAIAALAFGRRAVVVDGNVERVMARLFAVATPLPAAKPELTALAARLTPAARAGDYAEAVMDLGATICVPRRPRCPLCPWRRRCAAHRLGRAEALPRRSAKKPRPERRGVAFWLEDGDGNVLLRRRPEKGLLGGMMEVPSTPWRAKPWAEAEAARAAPARAAWRKLPGAVRHGFTHIALTLAVWAARVAERPAVEGIWWPIARLDAQALPTAMKKVARHARGAGEKKAAAHREDGPPRDRPRGEGLAGRRSGAAG
jgi:A/G-specific adenine glycosylase